MLEFVLVVIVVSMSGVMSPGPLFISTISGGLLQKRAGIKIAVGHMAVELPLILLIGLGVLSLESLPQFRTLIAILGAVSIFVFSGFQIHSVLKKQYILRSKYSFYATGVLLTGLNPFFLGWWFTIGIKLITDSIELWQIWGILIVFGLHIWMDFAWLGFISVMSSKMKKTFTGKIYKICMMGINSIMIYFGISFLLDALTTVNNFKI